MDSCCMPNELICAVRCGAIAARRVGRAGLVASRWLCTGITWRRRRLAGAPARQPDRGAERGGGEGDEDAGLGELEGPELVGRL